MITEEERRRQRYRNLRGQLRGIQSELDELNGIYLEMESLAKQSILIDNKLVDEAQFSKIKNTNAGVMRELRENVLPSVSSKC